MILHPDPCRSIKPEAMAAGHASIELGAAMAGSYHRACLQCLYEPPAEGHLGRGEHLVNICNLCTHA